MDIRQSSHYKKYIESIGWIVEKAGEANVFVKKLGPTSLIKIQRPLALDIELVDKIIAKYHPILVKVEPLPNFQFSIPNFQKDTWPLLPTKTIVLDLQSEICDLQSLSKDTRYEIRKAQSNGLTIHQSTNIELFYKLLQETMKIGNWSIPIKKEVTKLYESFQPNNSVLLFVSHRHSGGPAKGRPIESQSLDPITSLQDDTMIAGCLVIWHGDTAHYMYAACNNEGRKLSAPYFLLWETIKFCQEKKLNYLDLEGIYDERFHKSTKNWQGFSKFKMGWNGQIVEYPGSFIKYYIPFLKFIL